METWIIVVGVVVIVLFAIYHSGAESEKALGYRWVAQFKDQSSNDVIVRVFSSKEIYEGSKDLKNGDYKEALNYFNSVSDEIKSAVFSERDQELFNHPAMSQTVAPISFKPDQDFHPPEVVLNWLDLMAWFAGQELIGVNFYSADSDSLGNGQYKFMIDCPACSRKMNIPADKRIKVTCPHCSIKFEATT